MCTHTQHTQNNGGGGVGKGKGITYIHSWYILVLNPYSGSPTQCTDELKMKMRVQMGGLGEEVTGRVGGERGREREGDGW